ncbi:50S ribosomal protein L9 domain protein [Anaerococcus hydrogenalis]|nr:50S ribosomal protein L9 domain protein [Anaerococcus hydrogenalis]
MDKSDLIILWNNYKELEKDCKALWALFTVYEKIKDKEDEVIVKGFERLIIGSISEIWDVVSDINKDFKKVLY